MTFSGTHGLRVARRVVALFVACALLPVATTLALVYSHVQEALLEQRIGHLRDIAADYSGTLFERLGVAEALAGTVAASLAAGGPAEPHPGLAGFFRAAVVFEDARPRIVFGAPSRVPDVTALDDGAAQRAPGSIAIAYSSAADGARGIWLVGRAAASAAGVTRIALEIEPRYLWGAADDLPYLTDVCVLDSRGAPLHCSKPLPPEALAALRSGIAAGVNGETAWESAGVRHLSGFLDLFLKARFGAESWSVAAIQPEEHALAPVRSVRRFVVPFVLLGLLVAALLGLVQVRRTLGPLRQLTDATTRIAARDFGARVPVTRDDEFGALAAALNTMAARLGRQFQSLEANAEIDGVILSGIDIAQIATIVLRHASELLRGGRCVLLLADGSTSGTFRVHTVEDPGGASGCALTFSGTEIRRLADGAGGLRLSAADPRPVTALAVMGMRNAFLLPVLLDGDLAAVVVLDSDEGQTPDEDDIAHFRELADRVAVALATARRDEELHRRAHYDALTHLPNRRLGLDGLARAVAAAHRHERALAVLFVDLDGFSAVNDSLGHAAGDQVLVQAAARLRECVRESDLVARLGGDEFALVLPEIREGPDAALAATHVIEALSRPFRVEHDDTFVSASIGIALYPGDGTTAEELLRHADLAMYRAKQKGRRQLAFFEPSMNAEAQQRLTLDRELRHALERGEFALYYQPQIDVSSGRIIGAEALIRWNHPERGLVPPARFIGHAESSALIEDIGAWALHEAARQFMAWRADGLGLAHVSVNVAPRQLRNPAFTETVAGALRASAMPAHALRLELTESAVIDNDGPVEANLAGLAALDVALELDDFGTGYSSLAYLQRLPVAAVKIDRSLVRDIDTDESHRAVVRAAIDMVHALGKTAIAEGVETAAQLAVLERLGCDAAQGYLMSAPVPAAGFPAVIASRQAPRRAAA